MADEQRTLTANFTANASGFASGTDEVKKKLTELNTALTQNKQAIKETNSEITKNRKEYDLLQNEIKKSGAATEEQEQRLQQLNDEYAQLTVRMGSLKTAESDLKQQIKGTTSGINEQSEAINRIKSSAADLGSQLASTTDIVKQALTAVFNLTAKYGAWSDDINTLAVQTGLSTEELQKFTLAAGVCDVELSDVTGSITRLKNNMQLARDGSAQLVGTFNALGVSFTNSDGSLRNSTDVFYDIIAAMGEIENATERDAYAMDLFGRTATRLNTLLVDGGESFREYTDAMSKYVLPQETLDRLNSFNDQLDTLKARGNSVAAMVGAEFAESFDGAFDAGNKFFDMIEESIENGDFAEFADDLANGIVALTEAAGNSVKFLWEHKEAVLAGAVAMGTFKAAVSIGNIISGTVTAIKSFKGATDAATVSQKLFNAAGAANPYVLIASLAASAVTAIGTFIGTTNNASHATDDFVERIEELKQQQDQLNQATEKYKQAADGISDIVDEYKDIKKNVIDANEAEERLYELQERLIDQYSAQADGIDLVNGSLETQLQLLGEIYNKDIEMAKTSAEAALMTARQIESEGTVLAGEDNQSDLVKYFEINRWAEGLDNVSVKDGIYKLSGTYEEQYSSLKTILDRYKEANPNYAKYNDAAVIWLTGELEKLYTAKEEMKLLERQFDEYNSSNSSNYSGLSATAIEAQRKGEAEAAAYAAKQAEREKEKKRLAEKYKAEKQLADDMYDVGEISANQYYNKLTSLRDNYLETQTHEWYVATKEIQSLYKQMSDSMGDASDKTADKMKDGLSDISDAYKKLLDDIDAEIERHNRELVDAEYTEKIQSVSARLAYEKLDDYSRKELEKELADINAEWNEEKYQRSAVDAKDNIERIYTQSQTMIESAPTYVDIDKWNAAIQAAFESVGSSAATGKTVQMPSENKVYNFVIQGANKTTEQIVRDVKNAIASGAI